MIAGPAIDVPATASSSLLAGAKPEAELRGEASSASGTHRYGTVGDYCYSFTPADRHRFEDDGQGDCAHCPLPAANCLHDQLLRVYVVGTPAPQGSKRHVGNGVMVESSKKVKPWRLDVKHAILDALPETWEVLDCPVDLNVTFILPRPRGHYRTGRNAHLLRDGAPERPAGKPDIDKILRSTMDAIGEARVWVDDSRVVDTTMRKVYETSLLRPGAIIGVGRWRP